MRRYRVRVRERERKRERERERERERLEYFDGYEMCSKYIDTTSLFFKKKWTIKKMLVFCFCFLVFHIFVPESFFIG